MTNTEYQPLNSSKTTRNYLLIALACTVACVGTVCLYQSLGGSAPVYNSVDLDQYACDSEKIKTCQNPNEEDTFYWSDGYTCKLHKCCPVANKPNCPSGTDRKFSRVDNCGTYTCCPKAPKCNYRIEKKKYQGKDDKGCSLYKCECKKGKTCGDSGKDADTGCPAGQKKEYLGFKHGEKCCPQKECPSSEQKKKESSTNGQCPIVHCCQKRPRCSKGWPAYTRPAEGQFCGTYTCPQD